MNNTTSDFRAVFKDRCFGYCLRLDVALFFITALLMLYLWRRLPPEIPLFYSLPWGEEQLASPWGLWGLLMGLLLLNLVNFILGSFFYRNYKYLSFLVWVATAVLTALGTLTIIKIILLIT